MHGGKNRPRFQLRLGIPEVEELFNAWARGRREKTLGADDADLAERVGKALDHLLDNPFHPGLESHEISDLTRRYGTKVFQSYVDNASEHAWRLFWVYGPARGEITWIGLEPHPEDEKNHAYDRLRLSDLPPRR